MASRNVNLATAATASAPRTRSRAAAAVHPNPKVTLAMLTLAETTYIKNSAMNAAKRETDKAKKELNILMAQAEVDQFDTTIEGVPCEAVIEAAIGNAVDVGKLRKLVPEEVFMSIVSATQDAVKNIVGENILMKCLVETRGEPSLKVRKKKVDK